jgi:hypothetical protein
MATGRRPLVEPAAQTSGLSSTWSNQAPYSHLGTVADSRNEAATCDLPPPPAPNALVFPPHGTIDRFLPDGSW